jgi:hypothetical protein
VLSRVQVSFGPYKLGALVGLEISATNFQQKERLLLQKLVQAAGGTYSAELFKGRTTHLMCKNGTGKKYRWVCAGSICQLLSTERRRLSSSSAACAASPARRCSELHTSMQTLFCAGGWLVCLAAVLPQSQPCCY